MNKTKVDDMLLEMITPKVKEIEEKFGKGQGLTQEDINTLLLKSQYNHINHLDQKLNEVTDSVKSLENKFEAQKRDVDNKMESIKRDVDNKMESIKRDVDNKMESIKRDVDNKIKELDGKFEKRFGDLELKFEKRFGDLELKFEKRFGDLEIKFASLETKFEQSQVKMQQTIITTMKWYIGGAGIVLVVLKALDLFIK